MARTDSSIEAEPIAATRLETLHAMTDEAATVEPTKKRMPFFQGLLPIDRSKIPVDLIAGVTHAALAIPEVMGYTEIAGMPVITGL